MNEWLLRRFGVDTGDIPAGSDVSLALLNAPHSWQVFLFLGLAGALVALVVYLYRREIGVMSRARRVLMTALRVAIVAGVLAIWLEPGLKVRIRRFVEPVVLVLVDQSESMTVRDVYRDDRARDAVVAFTGKTPEQLAASAPSRRALAEQCLNDQAPYLEALSARGRVQVLAFSGQLETLAEARASGSRDVVPDASETAICKALRQAVDRTAGATVAGVVVLSDGHDTTGEDPRAVADRLRERRIPVIAVPLGDPTPRCNVRVADVWAPRSVPREDPFTIEAQLNYRNVEAGRIDVQLLEFAQGAATGELVASLSVEAAAEAGTVDAVFTHRARQAGDYRYLVRAVPSGDEVLDTDNERATQVRVLERPMRVLLLAGYPSWEYRSVRNLLMRDQTVDLSCWLQTSGRLVAQDGNTPIGSLPQSIEAILAYDMVIAMDPDFVRLGAAWFELLAQFVTERSGGFLFQAGAAYAGRTLNESSPEGVRDLLPVEFTATAGGRGLSYWTQPLRLVVTSEGEASPILEFGATLEQTRQLHKRWPSIFWSCGGVRAKPGGQVLLALESNQALDEGRPQPVMVYRHKGAGRTLFLGYNETWRIRQLSEDAFNTLWVQAVKELAAGRYLAGGRENRLSTDRDVYMLSDTVRVTAQLFDQAQVPLSVERVTVELEQAGKTDPLTLERVDGKAGTYQAHVTARFVGLHRLRVAPASGDGASPVEHTFLVEAPRVELADPRLDRGFLRVLAERSGGALVGLDQVEQLAEYLPNRRESVVVLGKPQPLWDNGTVLSLLVMLLGIEWILRKKARLI